MVLLVETMQDGSGMIAQESQGAAVGPRAEAAMRGHPAKKERVRKWQKLCATAHSFLTDDRCERGAGLPPKGDVS